MQMPTAPDDAGDGDDAEEEEEELARYEPRGIEMLKAHLRAEEAAAWKREDEKRKQTNLPRRQRQQPRQPQPEGELEEEARVMWSRDGEPQDPHDTQAFAGACVHHLLIVSPTRVLLGFAKVLVTEHEAFIEEVHVSADARGQGLSYHIIAEVGKRVELSADALARLQVSVFNAIAKKSYANITFKPWEIPEGGVWTKADEPQKDCEMMATTVDEMTRAARLRAASNPLRAGLKVVHFVDGEVVAEPVDLEADRDEDRPARTAEEKNVISHGTRNLSDPLCAQMVGRSTWNWPLKVGVSNASSFGYHLSCDAGRVKGGNRLMRQWSIVQVAPKCYGVKVSARRSPGRGLPGLSPERSRTPPARARHPLTPSLPSVRSGIAHRAGR
jgi:GNAT superfamily N-acetyltransferase